MDFEARNQSPHHKLIVNLSGNKNIINHKEKD
jgi:hypothetical protein